MALLYSDKFEKYNSLSHHSNPVKSHDYDAHASAQLRKKQKKNEHKSKVEERKTSSILCNTFGCLL
jgi:hypothetical protein